VARNAGHAQQNDSQLLRNKLDVLLRTVKDDLPVLKRQIDNLLIEHRRDQSTEGEI